MTALNGKRDLEKCVTVGFESGFGGICIRMSHRGLSRSGHSLKMLAH